MNKSAMALGLGATLGITAMAGGIRLQLNDEVAADLARSMVVGVILGSRTLPNDWKVAPAASQSRLQLWSSLCGSPGHSDGYGLATVGAGFSDPEPPADADKVENATPQPSTER